MFDIFVVVKLGAVVSGDGGEELRLLIDELDGSSVSLVFSSGIEPSDEGVASFYAQRERRCSVVSRGP